MPRTGGVRRHPRTPMRATAADSAPKASPVREPGAPPPQSAGDGGRRVDDQEDGQRARRARTVVGEEVPGPGRQEDGRRPRRHRRASGSTARPRSSRATTGTNGFRWRTMSPEQQAHHRQAHPPRPARATEPGSRRWSPGRRSRPPRLRRRPPGRSSDPVAPRCSCGRCRFDRFEARPGPRGPQRGRRAEHQHDPDVGQQPRGRRRAHRPRRCGRTWPAMVGVAATGTQVGAGRLVRL